MPLFTKTGIAIASLLAIPVFGTGIIAANYSSPILQHLVDIVNGSDTQTVVSMNAPNWSEGIPLAVPVGVSAATSTGGTIVATSTPYYFQVAALDGTGTTTVSATVSATTPSSGSSSIQVTWRAIPGAQGYAVYFSTSTPDNLTRYFVATSTNGTANTFYSFATSTGSLAGTNTLTDSTAFSTKINPNGQSYFNGGGLQVAGQAKVGTTTAASSTAMEINGYLRAQRFATSTECYAATKGAMFFNNSNGSMWGCNGTAWIKIF